MPEIFAAQLQPYHPTTFLERGVAVPFTTPMLAGTRARPMERAKGEPGGAELIVPNPSGGAGAYILPWSAVRDLCRPTLHDTQLNERVAALPTITPAGIRDAAREIAEDGLAGRAARQAVAAARAQEQQDRLLTNFLLLLALVKQCEPPGSNPTPPEQEQPAVLEQRAKRVIAQLGPRIGLSADRIARGMEELAVLLNPIGIGRNLTQARFARAVAALSALRDDAGVWADTHDDDSASNARMIADVANLTLACADKTIADARALADDMPALLARWDTKRDTIGQIVTRPDWLLDGWEQICLIWADAGDAPERRAALTEIALMVPIIPREAASWMDDMVLPDDASRFRRNVKINHDWRTGMTVFERIARNEHLHAEQLLRQAA